MLESVSEKNRFQLPLFVLLSFPTFTLLLERNPLWKHSTSLFSVYWQFVFNVLVILHWNWINEPLGSHLAKIIHIETTIAWPFPSEKREKASERKIVASWNSFTFKQSVQVHQGTEMRESTELSVYIQNIPCRQALPDQRTADYHIKYGHILDED